MVKPLNKKEVRDVSGGFAPNRPILQTTNGEEELEKSNPIDELLKFW